MAEKANHTSPPPTPTAVSRSKRLTAVEEPIEGRLFLTLVKAVVAINALLLSINIVTQWGLWDIPSAQTAEPSGLQYQVHDLNPSYPRLPAGPHTVKHWIQMTQRQAPPAGNASSLPIQAFSVDVPLLGLDGKVVGAGTPDGYEGIQTSIDGAAAGCQVTLGVNVFASSFGAPFVGNYTPPACLGDSNTAVLNLTVQTQGRQFDRLAIV